MNRAYFTCAESALAHCSLEPLVGRTLLVTGATGLLGSHLCAAVVLANQRHGLGIRLIATSRSPPPPWLAGLFAAPHVHFEPVDLSADPDWLIRQTFDAVVHGATYGQPKRFLEQPFETIRLNGRALELLLERANQCGARVLFLSTSEIYAPSATGHAVTEDHPCQSPLGARGIYTSAKIFGETLCRAYAEQEGLPTRVARVSSVYGPGVRCDDHRVIYEFIRRAMKSHRIALLDQGAQERCWLYAADATAMLFWVLLHSKQAVYNVAGTERRSILQLAELIAAETGASVELPHESRTESHTAGSPQSVHPDIRRLAQESGLLESVELQEGVAASVDWMRERLHEEQT